MTLMNLAVVPSHRAGACVFAALFTSLFLLALVPRPALAGPGKCDVPIVDPLCEAGKTVAGKASDLVTAPVRYAAGSALDMLTSWVSESARWLLEKVVDFIDDSTSPDLTAAWFAERYRFMVGMSALVLLPMLLVATIGAVVRQDLAQLLRSFFVHLPVAILGTFVAVFLTRSLLATTDALSAAVGEEIGGDVSEIFDSVGDTLSPTGPFTPSFAIFFAALLLIVGSFFVWLELLIRSAAVTVSVFFLPLILAALVWPATARWTRRLIETLIALILSKFVIVAVISLATAALADPGKGGFGAVMGAAALMLMAAFSPIVLLKLIPVAEGAALAHLEGVSRRPIDTIRRGGAMSHSVSHVQSRVTTAGTPPQMAVAGAAGASAASRISGAPSKGAGVIRTATNEGHSSGDESKRVPNAGGETTKERHGPLGHGDTGPTRARKDDPASRSAGGGLDAGSRLKPAEPDGGLSEKEK